MSKKSDEDYCHNCGLMRGELEHLRMIIRGLLASGENKDKVTKGYRECAIGALILCAALLIKVIFF